MVTFAEKSRAHNDTPNEVLIDVQNLHKSFGDHNVLNGVTFQVHEGEVVAIIGISGCGKSTLLKVIGGIEEPNEGDVILHDTNYAMVFQYSALFDSLTVMENVGFSLIEEPDDAGTDFKRMSLDEIRPLVKEKLRLVGLDGTEDMFPNELSGGMKKRVSFARAIVSNPNIILYDEPTAGLDPIASTVIEDYILKLRNELNAASVVVTHQFSTITRTADRVCLLHEGAIKWIGTPEELMNSDDPYARQFAEASIDGPMTTHA